ncbi:protein tramtrack, beta isoform isoform X8 [Cydia amplana]|uniref:protein tramtrack, beta isoform isoform X8 n=1 Tax=Cydia amplana TaxID=1869771 RepID=UPI002FE62041
MASDEQFSLCWNNFHANMSAGFHGLLSRGDLVDVTLAAEGRLLQAHKLVLSVCSPYFQEMFKMNPTQHPIVFLKDVSHSALRDLLQFMYQGEVNVKQEELASFISTAEQLQVKGLTGNQNEESSTPSKPKPTSRPGPRSSQQRQSVMTKLETDLDSKPSSTPVAIKRPNRPSIASNNSSSSQSGPVKRKCVDPLEAGPSGSAKEEFVTIPDEDENNAVAPKMEPEFVNESMWDDDDDGTNNDETNFGEDDSNMEMTGFDGSTTGDGNLTGGAEGGAVGDAQANTSSAPTQDEPTPEAIVTVIPDDDEENCLLTAANQKPRKMTRAQQQRRYMQKIREDPEKEAEMRRKNQERYHRTKKLVKDMSPVELRQQRNRWKAKAKRAYEKLQKRRTL